MQRRGESEQPVKGRRHRASRPKARKALTARLSNANLQKQLDQRTRELDEALEQLAATSEVLKVISTTPGELEPVFNAMLENATRICEAKIGVLYLRDGDSVRAVAATHDAPPAYVEARKQMGWEKNLPADGPIRRAATTKQVAHVTDIRELQSYRDRHPAVVVSVELGEFRTVLSVPMLKDDELIGVITLNRQEVRPFTDKQIELVKNFAAQAVIAIENMRLLNELRQRTDDLTESLEQQTATSEVLSVISSSSGELQPVFDTMLANAVRICEAKFGTMLRAEEDGYRVVAMHGPPPAYAAERRRNPVLHVGPTNPLARVAASKQLLHIADIRKDRAYLDRDPAFLVLADDAGARTLLMVPMLKENKLIGAIAIYRQEVRPFTDKQIELVKNFAAQAVIAIENARLLNELRQRTDDLSESLKQQTATSEVLKVISSSPGELKTVFNAMLENATHICEAKFGVLFRYADGAFNPTALVGVPQALAEFYSQRGPFLPPTGTALDRLLQTGSVTYTNDETVEAVPAAVARYGGARSLVAVPMLKDNKLIGAIVIYRQEVRPFTDKQIELVKNFAAQAVIAIENTRLLNELRESLQQQTATADVLKVISTSPGELEPVFNAMLENATRVCDAEFGTLYLRETDSFRAVAIHNGPPAYVQARKGNLVQPPPDSALGQVVTTHKVAQIDDAKKIKSYIEGNPYAVSAVELGGYRTIAAVPMLKHDELVGAILVYRQEVRSFSEKQIALLENFAAQAVIAIENTRLLNELRESLQQQTATADVLKVISSSPGDLEPVFQAMLQKATQICEAKFGVMFRFTDNKFRAISWLDNTPAYIIEHPHVVGENPHNFLTRIVSTKRPVHSSDLTKERAYIEGNPRIVALVENAGARSLLVVPMVKNEELIGAIAIYWQEVRSFTEKQIELISNFAAQAVIAIDNARLFSELRESLQQQTATADVLKVISRSTFDLQTVLQTLVESAARLCDADKATITRQKDGVFYSAEAYGFSHEFMDYIRRIPIKPERGSASARALLEGRVIHIHDVKADPEYTLVEAQRLGDFRTILAVPMLREGVPIGVLILTRSDVRPFTDKQIELVTTFADQAAIAIENVRLFESVEARTRELAKSLEDLRTTQDRLVQTQKLASLGQLTAGIAHEIKNPLNFVNNFSGISGELIDELLETLKGPFDDKARTEINELAKTLRGNLDKIAQHGKRADAIVKNMLLHSREGSGEHRVVDINALVEESLNLAYHGKRAEKQGFNITLERSFDPAAGLADVFPQDITRVLLNLIANGFYAATKRKAETDSGSYEPTLAASTRSLGDRVEIRVRDNGSGIPPEVKEKIFNPFFTTKPAGEGTGLGLSISHDIIVKQHGGSIEVETEPGEYTEFRIILPRTAAFVTASGAQS